MHFPPGRPLLILFLAGSLAGAGLLALERRPHPRANLVLWTFDPIHAAIYRSGDARQPSLLDQYWRRTGLHVDAELIQSRALDSRLLSLFHAQRQGRELPDLVEIEIASLGRYVRGDAAASPLLPLNSLLEQSPLLQRLVPARLKSYTQGGVVMGIPFDLHPVTLTYRKDLFDEAGVELAECKSWEEFHRACLCFERYWADNGQRGRRAMEFSRHSASELMMLLLQQGINLIDEDGGLHLAEPAVARTLAFYAGMVAGPDAIAGTTAAGGSLWVRDLAEGRICAALTPDWRIAALRQLAPQLAGKVAMMPLPRFSPGDSPTSTWGGTMLAIPRAAADPQASWALLEFILGSRQGLAARQRYSDILPPLRGAVAQETLEAPDPFFGNQPVARLYYELGQQVPARIVHPYTPLATQALADVLEKAAARLETQGDAELEAWCHDWLLEAQQSLAKLIAFDQQRH